MRTILTAEQIVKIAQEDDINDFNVLRKRVYHLFLLQDDSCLWPVNNRFNVTKRAERRIRRAEREGLIFDDLLSYALTHENIQSEIVNSL